MLKTFKQILSKIEKYKNITIFTHLNPDGDTIGSAVAMKNLIKLNFKNKNIKISGEKYPKNFKFLENKNCVTKGFIKKSLAILVDTSSIARCFDKRIVKAQEIIKIDHHHPEGDEWSIKIEGDTFPACGQIIYNMAEKMKLKTNLEFYEAIFVAIWTDTSGLNERIVDSSTEKIINEILNKLSSKNSIINKMSFNLKDENKMQEYIKNGKKSGAVTFKIYEKQISNSLYRPTIAKFVQKYKTQFYIYASWDKKRKSYRVTLRSQKKDVSELAKKMGGGGHKTSSGFYAKNKEQIKIVINKLKK